MELVDVRGNKLARLKSNHISGMGHKKLELLVPCDPVFLDLVVASAMTVKFLVKAMNDAAGEVVGAVVDAGGGAA